MKNINLSLLILTLCLSVPGFAKSITCTITSVKENKASQSVTIALPGDGEYVQIEGVACGKYNLSADLMLSKGKKGSSTLDVTFNENNEVQDEVGQSAWTITSKDEIDGSTIVENEPLLLDGEHYANFSCVYSKD